MKHILHKREVIFSLLVMFTAITVVLIFAFYPRPTLIANFDDCVEAGNPVMESYPAQCRAKDGKLFVQPIAPIPTAEPTHTATTCGNGVCEEIRCIRDEGCPKSETRQSCPFDCFFYRETTPTPISDSIQPNGVKLLDSYSLYEGNSYKPHYTINYPSNWNRVDTVFYDSNNLKVAESPYALNLKSSESCLSVLKKFCDDIENDKNSYRTTVLSLDPLSMLDFAGAKLVTSITADGADNPWYPTYYCIEKDDQVFIITFYERQREPLRQEEFSRIISSVQFVD